ncbi:hypothetical protein T01_9849 [Trichinella spiralis]|uniref:Uncharacterized protein n=1 Tax=Trichinella spiralis TaxID=6334 RepID=A0A0V1B3H8_TRISP|nr:hypothetical protein T01_9849 [Trichinella spiralis]
MENNAHGEERRQVEKTKIGDQIWIGWIELFVGQLRSLVNSVRWSSEAMFRNFTLHYFKSQPYRFVLSLIQLVDHFIVSKYPHTRPTK